MSSPAPTSVLGRFGGMLLRPRATLASALAAPGRTANAVSTALLLLAVLSSPKWAGEIFGLLWVSPRGALSAGVNLLLAHALWEIFALWAIAWALGRLAGPSVDKEGVLAAVMLCAVPFGVLMLVGDLLRVTGLGAHLGGLVELLPQAPWRWALRRRGLDLFVVGKLALAYLPTLGLLFLLTFRLKGRSVTPTPDPEPTP